MSLVFVFDAQRRPLPPVHPGRARFLLRTGYAAIFHRFPFTVALVEQLEQLEQRERPLVESAPRAPSADSASVVEGGR